MSRTTRPWPRSTASSRPSALRLRVLFHPPVTSLPSLVRRRRPQRHGLRVAPDRRGQDVPRRQPRQPHRLDARAVRGHPRPRHADHRPRTRRRARCGWRRTPGIACHRARHRRCGGATRARPDDAAAPGRACPIGSSTSSASTRPTWTARPGAGIVASMQPAHLLTDIPLVERALGRARPRGLRLRDAAPPGTALVFGSDVPVASIDPREGLFAALERRDADGRARAAGGAPRSGSGSRTRCAPTPRRGRTPAGARARRARCARAWMPIWSRGRSTPRSSAAPARPFRAGRASLTVVGGEVVMQR